MAIIRDMRSARRNCSCRLESKVCQQTVLCLLIAASGLCGLYFLHVIIVQTPEEGGTPDTAHEASSRAAVKRPTLEHRSTWRDEWQIQAIGTGADGRIDSDVERQSVDEDEVALFSAFFDDRKLIGSDKSFVRVNAVRPLAFQSRDLVCCLWYDGSESVAYVTEVVVNKAGGRGHRVTRRQIVYAQYLYSCILPIRFPVPAYVSIVGSVLACETATTKVPVQRPLPAASLHTRHQFVTCTSTTFGDVRPEVIVEWIEMNRIFGVTLFNIYIGQLSNDLMMDTFTWYAERGIVRVISLSPPVDDQTLEGNQLTIAAAFNDCLMANMYSSRFVIVLDFDELIIPRRLHLTNYTALVDFVDRKLGKKSAIGQHTYSFRNAYFFKTYQPIDNGQPRHLVTLRHRIRSPSLSFEQGIKSFVNPTHCLLLYNHCCLGLLPGADPQAIVHVPDDIAMINHYGAFCSLDKLECAELERQRFPDDIMLRHKEPLVARVDRVLKALRDTIDGVL